MRNEKQPDTLQEAILYFSDPDNCLEYVKARRWPNGVTCPTCGSSEVRYYQSVRRWECKVKHPMRQFSVKNGTIFEDSPLGLDKWLIAMWLVANRKNGISSYGIHRALNVTQKTAWFMDHRIRLAFRAESLDKLTGEVEVDETFIGGLARNMHNEKSEARISGTGGKDKTPVMGFLQRGGKAKTEVIPNRKKQTLHGLVKGNVAAGSALYTDALASYDDLEGEFFHQVVDHAVEYVCGRVHTNGLENFWSLLKRGIKGTYVSVEPFHLFRYLDEQSFRYNNRNGMNDGERFDLAVRQIVGKRLTYAKLTGKEMPQA
ncbi:MAG: IS1595 family transposase [Terriglobia bacterium]|jgi:transposase-like protein